jgi:hypothetical protein
MSQNIQYSCKACGDIYTSQNAAKTCCTPFAVNEVQGLHLIIPGINQVSPIVIPVDASDKFVYENFGLTGKTLGFVPYYYPTNVNK